MWRKLAVVVFLSALSLPSFAQVTSDFSVSIEPALDIPLGPALSDGTPYYTMGGGGSIRGEYVLPFARFLYTGLGIDFDYAPLNSSKNGLMLLAGGPQFGLTFFPVPRLQLKVAGFGGMYLGSSLGTMTYSPYAGALADVSYLLNPSLSVGAGASFKNAFSKYGNIYQGIGIHIGASYHVGAGGGKANLRVEPTLQPVFPLFYSYYDEHPVGSMALKNSSPSALQDVSASFFVKEYMEQPKVFYRIPALDRDQAVTVPVQALFERSIFDVTAETKVAGEIAVTYKYLGSEVTEKKPVTVTINNRNAMTWDDDRKAAAFVTATDPDVMLFAKSIASDAGSRSNPAAINANFRIAMALFQAVGLHGVGYVTDPTTPYGSSLGNAQAIDYLQFPMQTLAYRAGDCDDLSILYSALLESAGVRTAFITVPGHIYMAFDLGMRPEDAKATFTNPQSLIIRENETWIPVEITLIRKGFTEAWRSGAVDWQTNNAKGAAKFMVVRDAWQEYRPVSASRVLKDPVRLPDGESSFKAYNAELTRFLGIDMKPRVSALQDELKTDRKNFRLMNKLGVLYARYGFLTDARIQFEAALRSGGTASSAVLVNLGNVSFLNGSFEDAVSYYNKALQKSPNAAGALRGLALASYEAGDIKQVDSALARLKEADPESADKLAALGSGTTETSGARAASADKEVNTWSEE